MEGDPEFDWLNYSFWRSQARALVHAKVGILLTPKRRCDLDFGPFGKHVRLHMPVV